MNFQTLPPINKSQTMLDSAFNAARVAASKLVLKSNSEVSKIRRKEVCRLDVVKDRLCGTLKNILKQYPVYEDLDEFHKELFNCFMDVDQYRQDMSKIHFAEAKIFSFNQKYSGMMKASNDLPFIQKISKEFYGRVSSILKRIDKPLDRLEGFRRTMKTLPDVKEGCINVALFGFPNVGKSTILSKITTARPEIAGYAFTTKKINMGYQKIRNFKIQIMDTPGTLNRFEKMNEIEKMAYLVVDKLADAVIYVFDPTYAYSIEEQEGLFEIAKKNKNLFPLVSKVDLFLPEVVEKFKSDYGCKTIDELDDFFENLVNVKEKEMLDKL